MEWISVKDRLPDKDTLCLVVNKKRLSQCYVSFYNHHFQEFEVNIIGSMIKLPDPITFNATHWIPIPTPR